MTNAFAIPRTPAVLRIRATVAADGTISAFGLTYRPHAGTATLRALARAGRASLLVDAANVGSVLVRDPATGGLIRADCTRHAYASGLTLPVHAAARRTLRAAPCRVAHPAPHSADPTPWHDGPHVGSAGRSEAPSMPVQAM